MRQVRLPTVILSIALPFAVFAGKVDRVDWMLQTNRLGRTECRAAPDLPNVLVLGDSISIGYTPFLRRRFEGVAHVSRPKVNCAATQFYLRTPGGMRDWVGTNKWDIITVNSGIWDIWYVRGDVLKTDHYWGADEKEKKLPPLERGTAARARGFRIRTPIPEYSRNLREILTFLKSTGATVLFALTTPCPTLQTDDRCGLVRAYNEVATQVCQDLSVRIVDLYAVGERNYRHQTDRTHYDDVGNDDLARTLEAEIRAALKFRKRKLSPASVVSDADRKGFGPLSPSAVPCERQYLWPEGKMPYAQPHQVAEKLHRVKAKDFDPDKNRCPFIEWYAPVASNRADTCVLVVSGGGFNGCCDAGRLQPAIDRFVRAGLTVANLTYRTPRPKDLPIHQSAWADAQRAVRVIRSEAKRRGFSPDRIGATGISAGAKAILLLALSSQTPAYAPVDELDGLPCNLQFAMPQAPAYVLTDGAVGENKNRGIGAAIVPELKFDGQTCPLCLLQGGTDSYSPLGSVRLYQRVREMGLAADIHIFADRWHGFHGNANHGDDGTAWDHWCDRMLEFVGRFDPKVCPERFVWSASSALQEKAEFLSAMATTCPPTFASGSEGPRAEVLETWLVRWMRGEQCDLHLEARRMMRADKLSRIWESLNHHKANVGL